LPTEWNRSDDTYANEAPERNEHRRKKSVKAFTISPADVCAAFHRSEADFNNPLHLAVMTNNLRHTEQTPSPPNNPPMWATKYGLAFNLQSCALTIPPIATEPAEGQCR